MICGFDNMAARKLFYSRWKAHVDSKASEEEKPKRSKKSDALAETNSARKSKVKNKK